MTTIEPTPEGDYVIKRRRRTGENTTETRELALTAVELQELREALVKCSDRRVFL